MKKISGGIILVLLISILMIGSALAEDVQVDSGSLTEFSLTLNNLSGFTAKEKAEMQESFLEKIYQGELDIEKVIEMLKTMQQEELMTREKLEEKIMNTVGQNSEDDGENPEDDDLDEDEENDEDEEQDSEDGEASKEERLEQANEAGEKGLDNAEEKSGKDMSKAREAKDKGLERAEEARNNRPNDDEEIDEEEDEEEPEEEEDEEDELDDEEEEE